MTNLCHLLFSESEATTQSSIEKAKEDFDDTVNHIAIKTGLKPVHVIVFVICKLWYTLQITKLQITTVYFFTGIKLFSKTEKIKNNFDGVVINIYFHKNALTCKPIQYFFFWYEPFSIFANMFYISKYCSRGQKKTLLELQVF